MCLFMNELTNRVFLSHCKEENNSDIVETQLITSPLETGAETYMQTQATRKTCKGSLSFLVLVLFASLSQFGNAAFEFFVC